MYTTFRKSKSSIRTHANVGQIGSVVLNEKIL